MPWLSVAAFGLETRSNKLDEPAPAWVSKQLVALTARSGELQRSHKEGGLQLGEQSVMDSQCLMAAGRWAHISGHGMAAGLTLPLNWHTVPNPIMYRCALRKAA